jgi:hypothetical protein
MFGTIRRHQTWLWAVIIVMTVISFVYYFSPYQRMDRGGGAINLGSVNGERVTKDQYAGAWNDSRLYMFFTSQRWPDDAGKDELEKETYKWILLLQKEEDLGIYVGPDEAAQAARQMLAQFERGGLNDPKLFVTQVLGPRGLQMEDFERFCRHYLALQELMSTVGLSGRLVTPQEAKALYERNHQELATEAVFFSASNYLAKVTVMPAAVAQFYSNQLANYRIPERVQVNYVEFPLSNFVAKAEAELKTNLTEMVAENLRRLGTNYTQFGKTPDEAKAKIREEIIRQAAARDARLQAAEFASRIDTETPVAANFSAQAKTNGLTVRVTEAFTKEEGPRDLELGPDASVFAKAAFSLSPDQPFAGPFVGQDAAYEIGFNKRIPSEIPTLDQIRDRVVADYRFNQALLLAHQAGMMFAATLTNGMAQGKSFADLCASAQVKPEPLPPLSLSTQEVPAAEDRAVLNQLKQAALGTPPGKTSAFAWPDSQDLQRLPVPGGFILYVKSKLPMDEARMKTDLPRFTTYVRQRRAQEAFNLWFSKEAEKGLRDTPVFKQPPPTMSGTSKS